MREITNSMPCESSAADSVRWRTAALGGPADTSPAELAALGDHLNCGLGGKAAAWRRLGERLNRFLLPRFVSTLMMALLLIAGAGFLT